MVHRIIEVDLFDLVIIGATGDLSLRKLLPALYRRDLDGQLPEGARIIGCSRTQLSREEFQEDVRKSINTYVQESERTEEVIARFLSRIEYVPVDVTKLEDFQGLAEILDAADGERIRIFYLSVGPSLFQPITDCLHEIGLSKDARLVVEKPFGRDFQSAKELNDQLSKAFDEHHIYRIDHYLGKETVQNLMALRFANALFEPLWNRDHIDHVQITVAESIGIEGRGGYYGKVGAMRDMVQNHLLQLLCLTAMEPPHTFDADAVRDEKLKILKALEPLSDTDALNATVRGQYLAGDGTPSFLDEVDDPKSLTESFVAIRAKIASWRWAGTPFYLRTGKRLRHRMAEIAITFKEAPHSIFTETRTRTRPNVLVIRLQPDEGLTLSVMTKEPGPGGFRLREFPLDMSFAEELGESWTMPDAYERLLMDVVRGNQTLFMRRDEVEASWAWIDPIIEAWHDAGEAPERYHIGGIGPTAANKLLAEDGRSWREITLDD